MQAFLAILRYDLGQLVRSWITRIWLPLLVAPALFLVVVAANEAELASETLGAYVAAVVIPISGLAIAVLTAGAISGEASVIADGILSRSVTRTEFVWAKVVARLGFALAVYFAVMLPFVYLIVRYASPDTTYGGLVVGVAMVALILTFLGALGLTLSSLMSNVLLAVLTLLLVVVLSGVVLQFLGLEWMSTTSVLARLPQTFRGHTPAWDIVRELTVFASLTAGAIFASFWIFRNRDL
jgi:ABC-type transport system involved in multi-copper enzyme maturation permease subunit